MKRILSVLFLLLATSLYTNAQERDTRAVLDLEGRIDEISVSPSGKIWLTSATGNTYYTNSIDENWQYGEILTERDTFYNIYYGSLDRISFFNSSTAIMTGSIPGTRSKDKHGLFRTTNGGETWQRIDFGEGTHSIYDVYIGENGNAWMGGYSGDIFYSGDYGLSWETLNSPFNTWSRLGSIYMADELNGVAGASHNFIYTTNDNWVTFEKIETPIDQRKYKILGNDGYYSQTIKKVRLWRDYIVVNQQGHVFYTHKDTIDWKAFSHWLLDFEVNPENGRLIAINEYRQVLEYSSPKIFDTYQRQPFKGTPKNMKVSNGKVYVLQNEYMSRDYHVVEVSREGVIRAIPYTIDHKIPEPDIVVQWGKLKAGASGKHLYLSDDEGKNWYREIVLYYDIYELVPFDETSLVIWDGKWYNYKYNISSKEFYRYIYEQPINEFLKHPVKSVLVEAVHTGSWRHDSDRIVFQSDGEHALTSEYYRSFDGVTDSMKPFNGKIDQKELTTVLKVINEQTERVPEIKEFQITEEDIEEYKQDVMERAQNSYYETRIEKEDLEHYLKLPENLHLIDWLTIELVLQQQENTWASVHSWFYLTMINENDDTITFKNNYFLETLPWYLPWKVQYGDKHFNCYEIALSRIINAALPEEFNGKYVFSNSRMLMEIADHTLPDRKD